ncbi:helix-turn-helix transcriptional regulator [Flavihumibacter sp. CACIAM 22H1]|uniref:helix-turn-helix domain-containing protein n=1 Tax=Flavihumibacter sp. CACIAM 22H1 TaxID=1812911 RepID=UPI0007A8A4E4|nr:helix-turn-helix transcriptional regulator [Flavihumibacter sp. CACIAM 22H1]KYP16463.1 MAG: hypothetical protein A1D16_13330 [Flavihumibacter sp. CACIAM 22H1]
MTKIGANIKKIRTARGLSQQSFGELFDLTRGNISSYEESRAEPRLETSLRIANYFSIPLEHFISRSLTVNEILQFKGDKLIDEERTILHLQLRPVPFLNENIYMKCSYQEMRFTDFSLFPQLVLPETTTNALLAVAYQPAIPHHSSLEGYQVRDLLVFEEVTRQNVHLCQHKTGLFTAENEIFLGRYEQAEKEFFLVLNDFSKQVFDWAGGGKFWRKMAVYRHEAT